MNRLAHLPAGLDLVRYGANQAGRIVAQRLKLPVLPHPASIMLEVTSVCQLHCRMCARASSYGRAMNKGHMPFEKARRIIDENGRYLDRIALTGLGEPLLYPDLAGLVDYIRASYPGISIFLSTNALAESAPQLIARIAPGIDTVQISCDGVSDTYEEVRGRGNFERFRENLGEISRACRGKRASVKMNMVVMKENFNQVPQIIDIAAGAAVDELYINTRNLAGSDQDVSEYAFYRTTEYLSAMKSAVDYGNAHNVRVVVLKKESRGFSSCPYPWTAFTITWDGYLVPCCAKPFPKVMNFGNVFEKPLLESINDPRFRELRLLSRKNMTPQFCTKCHYVCV